MEFSLLAYADLAETRYACLLEGYDEEWRAVDGAVRRAVYERVPLGDLYDERLHAQNCRDNSEDKDSESPENLETILE